MNIYPNNLTSVFEYDKLLALTSEKCLSKLGKRRVEKVRFLKRRDDIITLLKQTQELKTILQEKEPFPTQDYIDLSKELDILQIENSVLKENDFRNIYTICSVIESIFYFFGKRKQAYPELLKVLELTSEEKTINKEIDIIIGADGFVKSTASPDLAKIRKELSKARGEAEKIYNQVINKLRKLGWLSEDMEESVRNDRRVISIDSAYKTSFNGIIHDISATGKTTFMEPGEAIDINNKIFEQEKEERKEIYRILKNLSKTIRTFLPVLRSHQRVMEILDFTRAKAIVALEMNAQFPVVSTHTGFRLKNAYHPILLLNNKSLNKITIPFDVGLNHQKHILIISGPNAGGKTICMKAIGLIQMMMQSGFLVPVDAGSEIGIFNYLMVDMGDTQSIEFELSTYSARLKNMQLFLKRAYKDTLLLIDEFGTGSDPLLGGALAEAILEELHEQKTYAVITTHYLNLKLVSEKLKGVINGAMSYDPTTLTPLYELKIGKPGSSFTFAVAEKIGLPSKIIAKAKSLADNQSILMDELLNNLEKEIIKTRRQNEKLSKETTEAESKKEKYTHLVEESKNENFKSQIKELKHRLNKLETLEAKSLRFVKNYLKTKGKSRNTLTEQYVKSFNVQPSELYKENEKIEEQNITFNIGDKVRLKDGKTTGIIEEIKGKKIKIRFGNLNTIAETKNLTLIESAVEDENKK